MKNDKDAISPGGSTTADNSNVDVRKVADPKFSASGSWRGVIRRVAKTTPIQYVFNDTDSNPKVIPLLPYSPAASKLVARASPVDPRYVDLEQAPVENKSKRRRSRLPTLAPLRVMIFTCLFGGFAVTLLTNYISPDHTVRAKSLNPGKLAPGTRIQSISGHTPDGKPIQANQIEPTVVTAHVDNNAHLSPSQLGHHVPEAKTTVHNTPVVEIPTLTTLSTDHAAHPLTADPPITQPNQTSEQITTSPPSKKSLTTAAVEPVTPSKPVPERAIETLSMSEILELGQQLLKSGDVTAARTMFRYAANKGVAQGALALGSTYDTKTLLSLGLAADSANVKLALRWYRRAHILGNSNP